MLKLRVIRDGDDSNSLRIVSKVKTMNQTQYRHWQTFAIRMAHRGWPNLPRKSRKRVANMVKDFFRTYPKDYDCDGTLLERIRDWDTTDPCKHDRERMKRGSWSICYDLVCDAVTLMEEHWNPYYWSSNKRKGEKWDLLWGARVRCCLRAGLDLASQPTAGVIGFEVCDLRRMYCGRIPSWINDATWEGPEGQQVDLNQGECAVSIFL